MLRLRKSPKVKSLQPQPKDEGSEFPSSCDGAEAAAGIDSPGSAVGEAAVNKGAATPAEVNAGSADEGILWPGYKDFV